MLHLCFWCLLGYLFIYFFKPLLTLDGSDTYSTNNIGSTSVNKTSRKTSGANINVSLVPHTEMMSHILTGSVSLKSTPLDRCFSEICLTMAAEKAGKALIIGAVLNANQTLDAVVQVQVNHAPYLLASYTQWETLGETTKSQPKRCKFHWNIMETKTTKKSHSYNQWTPAETKKKTGCR